MNTRTRLELIEQIGKTKVGALLWVKKEKLNTQKVYAKGIELFMTYLGKSINDLDAVVAEYVADMKASHYEASEKWEQIMTNFELSMKSSQKKKYESASRNSYLAAAVALVNASVPKSQSLRIEFPKSHSKIIHPINIDDLKLVDRQCKLSERVVIRVLKDSGISRADVVMLKVGDIAKAIRDGAKFAQIRLVRGKKEVDYLTHIGPNSIDVLKPYLEQRARNGETINDASPLFVNVRGNPLTKNDLSNMLLRVQKRTNIEISPHKLRKFFETYLALGAIHPLTLKSWMGHHVASDVESHYILPPAPKQLEIYEEAYRHIDLEASDLSKRVEELEKFKATLTPEQRATMERLRLREKGKKTPKSNDCENGNCQRIVSESELETLLGQGWHFVATLPSGKLLVSNE